MTCVAFRRLAAISLRPTILELSTVVTVKRGAGARGGGAIWDAQKTAGETGPNRFSAVDTPTHSPDLTADITRLAGPPQTIKHPFNLLLTERSMLTSAADTSGVLAL